MQGTFASALYAALIVLVVFLYIRMRRLEGHLHAVDATLDTLLAEAPPAEFLPSIEARIAALEKLRTHEATKQGKVESDEESSSDDDTSDDERNEDSS